MARRKLTMEEVNKELKSYYKNVEFIEYEEMNKPCKIKIADRIESYTKASKVMYDLRKIVNGGEFTNYKNTSTIPSTYDNIIFSDEVMRARKEIKEQLEEFYKVPTLEEIINLLGNNFTLHELKKHYPNVKNTTLSNIIERLKYDYKVHISYEKINDMYTQRFKIVS